ncbi:MAG: penicillin-binding protein activator [Rikenellaceae bacterium]
MKRLALTFLLTFGSTIMMFAITKSQVVVYINGEKYYIHTVKGDETIEAIAEVYEVDEKIITELNKSEINAGDNIKIPYTTTPVATPTTSKINNWFQKLTFINHKIEAGETLYSISRKYEISIDAIMEDNPSIDPIALPLGYELRIRKKMTGKSSAEENQAEWEEYQADLNMTTQSDGYIYHIVEKGETIYSLSREHNISEEELIELNNITDGLKAGSIIKFPAQEQQSHDTEEIEAYQDVEVVDLRSLSHTDSLKIALLLPLSSDDKIQPQFADFYNGFIMGLDEVKRRWGRDIELTLYDTKRDSTTVEMIVESSEFDGTNLIIGPIYEDQLAPIISYAERKGIAVVSPLASFKSVYSPILFQMAPPAESKFDKVKPLLESSKHVTLIYTEQTDSLFEQNIMSILGNRPFERHTYEYEHPTVVAEKISKNRESAGDLSKFINNGLDNTIVIMSSSETDVDRILSALSSAQINIVARGGKMPTYAVLGNSEWNRYRNIDRTILFKNNVSLISSYHAKRDNENIKTFDSSYIQKHRNMPSLFAYRGYDTAMIFGEALYSDMEYNLEGRTFTPLQNFYRFETNPHSGIHTNNEWIRVNYNNNYTITIE